MPDSNPGHKKISIVIPAYNEEEYLGETLDALAQQTLRRDAFEIIVVDNASSDQTSTIAYSHGADKIIHESRKGTNRARQTGLRHACGEIIAFLDADCIAPSDWLEKIYITLTKHSDSCAAVAGSYKFPCEMTDSLFMIEKMYRWIVLPAINTVMGKFFKRGGVIIGGNFASFKENLQKLNGLDTSYVFFGDDASIAKNFGKIGCIHYDPRLFVVSSTRRFEREGLLRTNWMYTKNYFKVMFKSEIEFVNTSVCKFMKVKSKSSN